MKGRRPASEINIVPRRGRRGAGGLRSFSALESCLVRRVRGFDIASGCRVMGRRACVIFVGGSVLGLDNWGLRLRRVILASDARSGSISLAGSGSSVRGKVRGGKGGTTTGGTIAGGTTTGGTTTGGGRCVPGPMVQNDVRRARCAGWPAGGTCNLSRAGSAPTSGN